MHNSRLSQSVFYQKFFFFLCAAVLGLVVVLPYFLQSQTAIDDSFITSRHSRNLARGDGLVFNRGQKVLGTTTPLWALGINWVFHLPISEETQGLLVCLFGGMLALWGLILWSFYWFPKTSLLSWILLVVLLLIPSTIDSFLMGMETGPLILACALFWIVLINDSNSKLKWAQIIFLAQVILLLRLDSVFFLGAFGLSYLIHFKSKVIKPLFLSGMAVALLTLSWLGFCKINYGHYFPHSMLAKSGFSAQSQFVMTEFLRSWVEKIIQLLRLDFPWPTKFKLLLQWLYRGSVLGGFLISFYRWSDLRKNQKVAFLGATLYILFYSLFFSIGRAGVFPWYAHLPCFIVYGVMVPILFEEIKKKSNRLILSGIFGGAFIMQALGISGIFLLRDQNTYGLNLGKYLKTAGCHSVMLEPIGYIGFFSDCTQVYDAAGLVSPEILTFRRTGQSGWFFKAVEEVKPQYIVLRRGEVEANVGFNIGVLFAGENDKKTFQTLYAPVMDPKDKWDRVYSLYKRRDNAG